MIKIENREKGRASRPHLRWGKHKLTEIINIMVTPHIRERIEELIEQGKFPNRSEFVRYVIIKYLDEEKLKE